MLKLLVLFAIVGGVAYMVANNPNINPLQPAPSPTNADVLTSEDDLPVTNQSVAYFPNSQGFVAVPETQGEYPGIVMIHEWWGLNDTIKQMALSLASQGYQVIAVDLYQGKVAATQQEAQTLVGSLDQEVTTQNLRAATKYLKDNGATKVAALGWCFGGGQSLQLSLSGEILDATVIYYGNLVTDQNSLANIKWPVLGIFGDQDMSIPVDTVKAFEASLNALNIDNQIHIYPGVGHAFANPTGANYAPEATQDAWNKTLSFLSQTLKT